jgi:hypothetical protein
LYSWKEIDGNLTDCLFHLQRRKKQRRKKKNQHQQVAASLPEGPLMEILSRVPYKSLCRFKCVSRSWLALCSNPDIRRRSPQTLSGFFHNHRYGNDLRFRNLSGRGAPMVDPALPFLRGYDGLKVEQCCGGLLLCRCWKSHAQEKDLVVCNPATEKWTVVPPIVFLDEEDTDPYPQPGLAFLGFDASTPSRFVVFAPLVGCLDDVAIYSSETGRWIRSGCDDMAVPVVTAECVFLNGFMHLTIDEPEIAAVDTEGELWTQIPLPEDMEPSNGNTSMGQSQGLLHAWYIDPDKENQLSVWVLEDYASDNWTLKHMVSVPELFDAENEDGFYEMFAIHPERNLVFITNGEDMTLSYDMDNHELDVICTSGEFLGGLPYVPCFAEWSSDGH